MLLTAAPALLDTAAADTAQPGFVELEWLRANGPDLKAVIWYPATGGAEVAFGKNPVFTGTPAFEGATPLPGQHPLVLMSHGLGVHYRSLGWLAAGLAERGAVVIAVNHPGSTFRDRKMPRGMQHWPRVADPTAAMEAVMADPTYAPLIDPAQVSAVGFSYGSWTALSAGGLTWGITDVSGLKVPALLIGLGSGADRLVASDTPDQGSGLTSRLLAARPDTRDVEIAPAAHFTMLPECTDKGAAILQQENDDPVCTDPAGTDRGAVHDKVVAEVAAFLGL